MFATQHFLWSWAPYLIFKVHGMSMTVSVNALYASIISRLLWMEKYQNVLLLDYPIILKCHPTCIQNALCRWNSINLNSDTIISITIWLCCVTLMSIPSPWPDLHKGIGIVLSYKEIKCQYFIEVSSRMDGRHAFSVAHCLHLITLHIFSVIWRWKSTSITVQLNLENVGVYTVFAHSCWLWWWWWCYSK